MTNINIQKEVDLKNKTTFKVGGTAEYYVEVNDVEELKEAVKFAKDKKLKIFILGGGSNILVNDEGIKGLVIKYNDRSIKFKEGDEHVEVTVGAGLVWDKLVEEVVSRGYQGIECLSGIPGSVGAAPIQNIGAYGQELKDVFVQLKAYDFSEDKVVVMNKTDCRFGYRDSKFKNPQGKDRYFILEVTLNLNKEGEPCVGYQSLQDHLTKNNISDPTIEDIRKAVLEIRAQKLEDPNVLGNAGSFFKNPIVDEMTVESIKEKYPDVPSYEVGNNKYKLFAGWLIEKAGWKGKSLGNAKVSDKNALVITNPGEATSEDIRKLADSIRNDVKDEFGIKLQPEVNLL